MNHQNNMNSISFENLKNRRYILFSLKPIFYDFKEALLICGYKEPMSFVELYEVFYNLIRNKNNRIRTYPVDKILESDSLMRGRHSFDGNRLVYFMQMAKHYKIANEVEDIEKEISILNEKINNIRVFNRNKYIINLLYMRET